MTAAVAFPEPDPSGTEDAFQRLMTTATRLGHLDGSGAIGSNPTSSVPWRNNAIYLSTACHAKVGQAADNGAVAPDLELHDGDRGEGHPWVLELEDGQLRYRKLSTRAWRMWDGLRAFRVVPASKATLFATEVQTQQEMGVALTMLREEAGLTITQLADKVKPLNIAGVGRSTIGRVFTGGTLCATEEALTALVKACGVDEADVGVWVTAWERARIRQKRRGRRPAHAATPEVAETGTADVDEKHLPTIAVVDMPEETEPDAADQDAVSEEIIDDQAGRDDEVIGTVQITRGHLRTAVVLSALAGLAATSSQAPGVRNAGAVVLGVAGGLALLDMLRASTGPAMVSRAVSEAA